MTDNRRTSTRHAVSLPGKLTLGDRAFACTVINLSLGGAQTTVSMRHSMGERCQLTFSLPTSADPIDVGATVRWADDKVVGLQFDGLRAKDVWALNEFFKQHAG